MIVKPLSNKEEDCFICKGKEGLGFTADSLKFILGGDLCIHHRERIGAALAKLENKK